MGLFSALGGALGGLFGGDDAAKEEERAATDFRNRQMAGGNLTSPLGTVTVGEGGTTVTNSALTNQNIGQLGGLRDRFAGQLAGTDFRGLENQRFNQLQGLTRVDRDTRFSDFLDKLNSRGTLSSSVGARAFRENQSLEDQAALRNSMAANQFATNEEQRLFGNVGSAISGQQNLQQSSLGLLNASLGGQQAAAGAAQPLYQAGLNKADATASFWSSLGSGIGGALDIFAGDPSGISGIAGGLFGGGGGSRSSVPTQAPSSFLPVNSFGFRGI